jgi:hypothetical protein
MLSYADEHTKTQIYQLDPIRSSWLFTTNYRLIVVATLKFSHAIR